MKKPIMIAMIVVIVGIGGYVAYGVLTSLPLSPSQTASHSREGLDIKLIYCSPFKKGRLIFGEASAGALVPYGKYWRMGANEATEITFNKDIIFAGKPVKAGSYRMYAVPSGPSWTIRLNSELGKWGYDEPDHSLDVLEVNVPVENAPAVTEQFTIAFSNSSNGVNMNIAWDKTQLNVPIQAQ